MKLLGRRIAVIKYRRPSMAGRFYLPDNYQIDQSNTLWEVVNVSKAVDEEYASAIAVGDILVTRYRFPVDTGIDVEDGRRIFILEPDCIMNVITKTWEDEPSEISTNT